MSTKLWPVTDALYRYTACLIMWGFVAHLGNILPDQLGLVHQMGTVFELAIDRVRLIDRDGLGARMSLVQHSNDRVNDVVAISTEIKPSTARDRGN